MRICDHWSTDPLGLHFEPPRLRLEPPWLLFECLRPSTAPFRASKAPEFCLYCGSGSRPSFSLKCGSGSGSSFKNTGSGSETLTFGVFLTVSVFVRSNSLLNMWKMLYCPIYLEILYPPPSPHLPSQVSIKDVQFVNIGHRRPLLHPFPAFSTSIPANPNRSLASCTLALKTFLCMADIVKMPKLFAGGHVSLNICRYHTCIV